MKNRKIITIISITFYLSMIILTIGSKKVYYDSQTEVTVLTPDVGFVEEDGVRYSVIFISDEMAKNPLFMLVKNEKNGTVRILAKELMNVKIGVDVHNRFFVYGENIGYQTILVEEGVNSLYDGKEVRIRNEENVPPWW